VCVKDRKKGKGGEWELAFVNFLVNYFNAAADSIHLYMYICVCA